MNQKRQSRFIKEQNGQVSTHTCIHTTIVATLRFVYLSCSRQTAAASHRNNQCMVFAQSERRVKRYTTTDR